MSDIAQQDKARYPEKRLQQAATDWLKHHWRYAEAFSDEEARGARIDSIGLLKGRLALIEVKVRIPADIIDHRPDRSQSLESKIAGALGPLYRREAGAVSETGNRLWDRQSPPLVAILAQEFSSLAELEAMLTRRSADWHFDFAVWCWTGSVVEVLASRDRPATEPLPIYDAIPVPDLIGRTPREKTRSLSELITLGKERGVGDLIAHLIQAAPGYGFKLGTGRWTIALKRRIDGYARPQTVLGAYLNASSTTGLNIGCWCEAVGINADDLPGQPATRSAGYMNTNRIVTSTEELDSILKAFALEP